MFVLNDAAAIRAFSQQGSITLGYRMIIQYVLSRETPSTGITQMNQFSYVHFDRGDETGIDNG